MNTNITPNLQQAVAEFRLPRYREIPYVGLYLEQTAKYINMHLSTLGYPELTTSMIGNYVKQKIISGPYKKQYGAEHIACLMVLVIMKSVLTIEDARLILDEKRNQYTVEEGYNIICDIFEAQLKETFQDPSAAKAATVRKKESASPSDGIVHSVIRAAVNKIHLDMRIDALRQSALLRHEDAKQKEKEEKKSQKSAKEGELHETVDDESANN